MCTVLIAALTTCQSSKHSTDLETKGKSGQHRYADYQNWGNSTRTDSNNIFVYFSEVWNIKKITSKRVCDYGNAKHNNTTTFDHYTSDLTNSKREG